MTFFNTFITKGKSAELRMVLERFHADDVVGREPDDGNLILFDESGSCL
jgi:hypothetical protein